MLEMLEQSTLQAEREKRDTTEFIEILKGLSDMDKAEVRGYMKCLRTMRIMTGTEKTER